MITNFEIETAPLIWEEEQFIPILIKEFCSRTRLNPAKAPEIMQRVNDSREAKGLKIRLTGPRFRKLCNYIRSNALIPLIATSQGYFVSRDPDVIRSQIRSLEERAEAISHAAEGLRKFL